MSNSGESHLAPTEYSVAGESSFRQSPLATAVDPRVPLLNLEIVRMRMDSLQRFLSESVNTNTVISTDQMDTVSTEIGSAIHQIIVNGAALLSCYSARDSSFLGAGKPYEPPDLKFPPSELKIVDEEVKIEIDSVSEVDCEIVELDAVELLAEHIHFCEICGKGFKRDANLRMHMRAHGNQYKTPEALAKPEQCVIESNRKTRFSCPFAGCTRNKSHKKFRPLKSVICVKNHFKRSHCPKMYACNRCNRKSFSVVADLKSHLRHCGEAKWRCSCGTSFSRKDKLFGHIGLFEGHMPAVVAADDEEEKYKSVMAMEEDDQGEKLGVKCSDNGFFDGLFDELGEIENYSLEDMWGNGMDSGVEKFIKI